MWGRGRLPTVSLAGKLLATGCIEYLQPPLSLASKSWSYQAIHDDRCCDACDGYDYTVWTDEEIDSEFPYAMKTPMLVYPHVHPHCRCAMVIIETEPLLKVEIPGETEKPSAKSMPTYIEKPLTQADINKVLRALTFTPDYDLGLPTGLGESLKKKEHKKHK